MTTTTTAPAMTTSRRRPLPLRRYRERACWTQAELAARAGVHAFTLSRIETGAVRPALRTRRAICQALGITDAGLVAWPEPEPEHTEDEATQA
jgi:DNA-binding XRE family transcriptional regulator